MSRMYRVSAQVERIVQRGRTLSWLGIPLLAVAVVLSALWMFPVTTPTVHVRWADDIEAAQRTAFERERSLVSGTRREDGSWAYLLKDTSHANVASIVQAPIVDGTEGVDRKRFEVRPPIVRPFFGLAPLQSFLGFGLGGLLLIGSTAATRRRRTVYAAVALALLLVGMLIAPLPSHLRFDNGEWMGDYEMYTRDRAHFENYAGHTFIHFPHHLAALALRSLDATLGATTESPARAFRWLSALAGGLLVAELLGVAIVEGWSAGALRYLALCVAAPVTLFVFGFREIGYLSLSAAGIPLLLRGFSVVGRRSSVIAAALLMGLRSAFHGFGLLSLAGGTLSALASVGTVRDRLARATVFGVWATAAWLGWLGWYLVGLKLPVEPGTAGAIALRPLTTPYVADHRLVEPILSGSGIRDIVATAVVVGVPVLLLGLLSRGGVSRERRLVLLFALPSLAFLVTWWPAQGVDNEMDLIFATFPAFFAGAWLCARTRGATVAALALAAVAHGGFWSIVRSADFAAVEAPVVQVRWAGTLGDAQREAIERSLGLSSAEYDAGSIWRYRVPDLSPQRLDMIVTHAMVDDIHGFGDGPVVHVRWVEDFPDDQRTAVERALGLYRAEHRTGSTWRYQVPDGSPDRFDSIASHNLVDDTYGFDDAADARFGPVVHVRWVDSLGGAQRTALERALGLFRAEHTVGTTWRYQVPDVSPQRLTAIIAHEMVADTNGFDRIADERSGPVIHVRWVETLGDVRRAMLERALGLYRGEHTEGTTWRYRVPDASPDRLRAIVAHDMVADTSGFDRGSLELDAPEGDVARLAAQPLVYSGGWHPPESDVAAPDSTWRWTQQTGVLSFANPNADSAFYLDYAARPNIFADGPQSVTVSIGDQVLQSFAADSTGRRLHPVPLPTAVLGTGDRVEIQIAVDRTFVPATLPSGGRDERELGIQVYHAFVVLR